MGVHFCCKENKGNQSFDSDIDTQQNEENANTKNKVEDNINVENRGLFKKRSLQKPRTVTKNSVKLIDKKYMTHE